LPDLLRFKFLRTKIAEKRLPIFSQAAEKKSLSMSLVKKFHIQVIFCMAMTNPLRSFGVKILNKNRLP